MNWFEHLHQQLDEVICRLDARTRLWRAVRAAHQGPDALSVRLKSKSHSELAPAPALRS